MKNLKLKKLILGINKQMNSIFDLVKDPSQLEQGNAGLSRNQYEQITPSRSVVGEAFPNGSINFRFQTNGTRWWVPSKSYIRMRCRLAKSTANNPSFTLDDGIAPNLDLMANLFQNAEFRIAGKTVARIADYLPQVDALKSRITKSGAWLNTVGEATNWWDSQFHVRLNDITVGSAASSNSNQTIGKVQLGFDSTSTFALEAATGIVTIGTVGTSLSCLDVLRVGDLFLFNGANVKAMRINAITSATTFVLQVTSPQADVGANANPWYISREVDISRDARDFELIWTPPLSIFDYAGAIPASQCELILNPATASVYKIAAVESERRAKIPGTDFDFSVQDMYLYVNTVEGPRVDNAQYYLDLSSINCQSDNLSGNAFHQKQFDVQPSTKSLIVAFQDKRVLTDSRYSATRFRSYVPDANNNIGSSGSDQTSRLTRFMVQYAGQTLPSPDADPAYTEYATAGGLVEGIDFTTQRYVDSLLASGAYTDYSGGGSETITEWERRGQYHYLQFARDGSDRSTRVSVNVGFAATANVTQARVLLFNIYSQIARVTVQNGQVTDVTVEDN